MSRFNKKSITNEAILFSSVATGRKSSTIRRLRETLRKAPTSFLVCFFYFFIFFSSSSYFVVCLFVSLRQFVIFFLFFCFKYLFIESIFRTISFIIIILPFFYSIFLSFFSYHLFFLFFIFFFESLNLEQCHDTHERPLTNTFMRDTNKYVCIIHVLRDGTRIEVWFSLNKICVL